MTLTKADIVDGLFAQNLFSRNESAKVIDTLFELIKRSLQNGEDILISGFGKFSVKQKQGRRGRNLQTGELIRLDSRKVVTFRYSGVSRTAINAHGLHAQKG